MDSTWHMLHDLHGENLQRKYVGKQPQVEPDAVPVAGSFA